MNELFSILEVLVGFLTEILAVCAIVIIAIVAITLIIRAGVGGILLLRESSKKTYYKIAIAIVIALIYGYLISVFLNIFNIPDNEGVSIVDSIAIGIGSLCALFFITCSDDTLDLLHFERKNKNKDSFEDFLKKQKDLYK